MVVVQDFKLRPSGYKPNEQGVVRARRFYQKPQNGRKRPRNVERFPVTEV